MTSRQRMLIAMTNGQPDMVPVAPDTSNMIPCRLTGKPFWDIYLYQDPPLWQAYIHCVKHFGFDQLARLKNVSRARITQITNLTLLAPDIQETILFLPRVRSGRDPITERQLRPIAAEPDWARKREMWSRLLAK